ncbi:YkgJ family cysteine cluster protein [Wenyingzhuangia sp. 2_MG-2023]|uniref:YkgJ family cysteine cluster protein n=1 Tax=Wenyingzhuangia sp. 2_MG-2023 TaxID=3062639 RepID=UPI0026E26806|nr:YkgJ family cysteine cluster protein [Wenyingzhuangia sp. 2_MG-2023]MDO6738942.1 YkgJ family cysteine cluster protein [Wenyingzhuangia sp. 2_MG-2023]MDO6803694.1 YkgJ family cysteine cluster protein [Wenyingzhuangia sp. 1_MG-2023]
MEELIKSLPQKAFEDKKENVAYFKRLKKRIPKNLDYVMQDLHDQEFERTDCLTCANCCKTTSPMFFQKDIERIAKHLKMKEQKFMDTYLERDSDDCYVLKSAPCTFLDERDNTCVIYDVRPKACSEYPHTNRKKFFQLTDLTMKNAEICPAAYHIIEALKTAIPLAGKSR